MRETTPIRPLPTWDVTARRRVLVVARDNFKGWVAGRPSGRPMAQHITTFCGARYVLHGWRGAGAISVWDQAVGRVRRRALLVCK